MLKYLPSALATILETQRMTYKAIFIFTHSFLIEKQFGKSSAYNDAAKKYISVYPDLLYVRLYSKSDELILNILRYGRHAR